MGQERFPLLETREKFLEFLSELFPSDYEGQWGLDHTPL